MKIKTSELTRTALDWAVAKIEGYKPCYTDGRLRPVFRTGLDVEPTWPNYSTDWAQGGPIIERERITLRVSTMPVLDWAAFYDVPGEYHAHIRKKGPTALIAAMRCYVQLKLGNEVEIPEELL